ncbi:MAG: hypothetical protein SGCHY_000525 [Lobulomycetales sp.]
MGLQHTDKVPPLNEIRALELGATFLSESVIFTVAVSVILAEAYRSSRASRHATEAQNDDINALEEQLRSTRIEQEVILRGLSQVSSALEVQNEILEKLLRKPDKGNTVQLEESKVQLRKLKNELNSTFSQR